MTALETRKPHRGQPFLINTFIVLVLVGLGGQAVACYLMPAHYLSVFKADYAGMRLFKEALGLGWLQPLSSTAFGYVFRASTLVAYVAYAGLLLSAHRANRIDLRRGVILVATVSVVTAIVFPPAMSSDVYSYLAYSHIAGRYHLNPYFTTPSALIALQDPVVACLPHIDPAAPARGLTWNIPTVYGPVWTLLSTGLSLLGGGNLFVEAVLLKIVEAVAVVVAAVSAYVIAEKASPFRAPVVFLAVGLNPLLLAEGPGNGHNDMLMMSLVLLASALMVRRRPSRAAFALGAAVGVKVIPILIVPWILWEYRDRIASPTRAAKFAAAFAGPLILAFTPYWRGLSTLKAILIRGTAQPGLKSTVGLADSSPHFSTLFQQNEIVIAGYIALTLWVLLATRREVDLPLNPLSEGKGLEGVEEKTSTLEATSSPLSWALAWAAESVLLIYFLLKMLAPWYWIWPWTAASASWNRLHLSMVIFFWTISLMTTWSYTLSTQQFSSTLIYLVLLTSAILILGINYFSYVCKINKKTYKVELCLFQKTAV